MDVSHDGRAGIGRVQRAMLAPGLTLPATVELPNRVDGSSCQAYFTSGSLSPAMCSTGLGLTSFIDFLACSINGARRRADRRAEANQSGSGAWCDCRKHVSPCGPQQVSEAATVGVPGGVIRFSSIL